MIKIEGIKDTSSQGLDNIFWFIIDAKRNCIVVDPGNPKPIMDFIEKNSLLPDSIILTHNHHDHTAGIPALTERFHCPVLGPENEEIESITQAFVEGDSFERMGVKFEILSLPGHTQDHIGFLADREHLFCGDVIFGAGCGNVPDGSYDVMFDSLQKCAKLNPSTLLYWGHEYTAANLLFASKVEPGNEELVKRLKRTQEDIKKNGFSAPVTLAEELKTNPFLRLKEKEIIASAEEHSGDKLSTAAEVFAVLRQWKSQG